jgi:hypothetical protein
MMTVDNDDLERQASDSEQYLYLWSVELGWGLSNVQLVQEEQGRIELGEERCDVERRLWFGKRSCAVREMAKVWQPRAVRISPRYLAKP